MVNNVTLIGRVGQDPDIKNLPSGTMLAKFSLATSRGRKMPDGTWQDETEWHNIVTFGKTAETVRNYVQKGMLLYVEGYIHYNKYEDKDGIKRSYTNINVMRVKMLEKRDSQRQNQSYSQPHDQSQAQSAPPQQQAPNNDSFNGTEDDVPF